MEETLGRRCHARTVLLVAIVFTACKDGLSGSGTLAEPPAPPAAPAPAPTAPPSPQAPLVITDGAGGSGPFRLSSLARLQADLSYSGSPGSHAVRLDVTSPAGTLYAQPRGRLSVGSDGRGTSRQGLEVAGTPIETFRMTGTWHFSLVVDGVPVASAAVDILE